MAVAVAPFIGAAAAAGSSFSGIGGAGTAALTKSGSIDGGAPVFSAFGLIAAGNRMVAVPSVAVHAALSDLPAACAAKSVMIIHIFGGRTDVLIHSASTAATGH